MVRRLVLWNAKPKIKTIVPTKTGKRNSNQWKMVQHSRQMDLRSADVEENCKSCGDIQMLPVSPERERR